MEDILNDDMIDLIYSKIIYEQPCELLEQIRNYYIRHLIVKIPQNQSLKNTKNMIVRVVNAFQAINEYRSIKLTIDVDNY